MSSTEEYQARPRPHSRNAVGLFVLLLVVGLALRLPLLTYLGTTDHDIWKIWSFAGGTHSLTDIYRLRGDVRVPLTFSNIELVLNGKIRPAKQPYHERADYVDYPPLTPLALGIIGKFYRQVNPNFDDTLLLNALTKLPGLLADVFTTCLIFFAARRLRGERIALVGACLFWFNPMSLLAGPLLAYQDPTFVAPLAACALLLATGRHGMAWAAFAVALLIKPQPVLAAPMLLLASLGRRSLARLVGYVLSAGAAALMIVSPFILRGTFINVLANNLRNANEPYLSANNCNLWWLASYARDVHNLTGRGMDFVTAAHVSTQITHMPRLIAAGFPDPRPWGVGFFIVFTGVVLIAWWRRYRNDSQARAGVTPAIGEALALLGYGATMLLTQVHENHAYGAIALLGATWWLATKKGAQPNKELLAIYLSLSVVVFLNLLIFYGLGQDLGENVIPRQILWLDISVIVALANLAIFGWWLVRWIRPLPIFRGKAVPVSSVITAE